MKKEKVSEKENEWKGILQNTHTKDGLKVNVDYNKLNSWKDMYTHNLFKDVKCQDPEVANFYQVGESNVTPDSFTTIYTNRSNYDKDYCNVGVNKDWNFTKEELNKFYHNNCVKENVNYKEKRIDFEFTPLTFWQLIPSIAINLNVKEIELTWLCFGMFINFKRNG